MKRILVTALFLVLSLSCGGDEGSFKADALAVSETARIRNSLDKGGSISPGDLDTLRKLYEKYPAAVTVRLTLRDAYTRLEDWASVRSLIEEVPESERTPGENLDLGKVLIKLGDYSQAAAVLEQLDGVDQDLKAVLLSRAYLESGAFEKAGAVLDSRWPSITESRNVDAIVTRGLAYFHNEEYDKAISTLEPALVLDPGSIAANNALSRIYSVKGDEAKASEYAQNVRDSFKRITDESRNKSVIVSKLVRVKEAYAAKEYETVISLCKELIPLVGPANKASLYQYQYLSYKALGMTQEADAVMRQARGGNAQ